jgi:hypothetical protein
MVHEIGVMWWEVRTGAGASADAGAGAEYPLAAYATPMADLLRTLHTAFAVAAVQLSYTPEKGNHNNLV